MSNETRKLLFTLSKENMSQKVKEYQERVSASLNPQFFERLQRVEAIISRNKETNKDNIQYSGRMFPNFSKRKPVFPLLNFFHQNRNLLTFDNWMYFMYKKYSM